MKKMFKKIMLWSALPLLAASCTKDEVKTYALAGTTPALTASANTLTLVAADTGKTALTFTGTPVDYGFNAVVNYSLEIDLKGDNFKAPTAIALGSDIKKSYTVQDLNNFLILLGVPAGTTGQIEARLRSDVNPSVKTVYSNVVSITATPFKLAVPIKYPVIYVPGEYQGWAPATAKTLASFKNDKNYEGYVNITGATLQFKFTDFPDWNHLAYGSAGAGKLTSAQGLDNNLKVPAAGYYRLTANLNDTTWTSTLAAWSVIGDATPGGWSTDTPLTYDAATDTWKATVKLVSDGTKAIKFRANGAWDINFGDTKGNGALVQNGDNLLVPSDGTYTVTLDLGNPNGYKYSIKKN